MDDLAALNAPSGPPTQPYSRLSFAGSVRTPSRSRAPPRAGDISRTSVSVGVPGPSHGSMELSRRQQRLVRARCQGHKRRELYASLEGWPRSDETRLQEAAPTGACRRSSSSPPRAQHRGRGIAITAIGARGHHSAEHQTGADLGPAVVTSFVGDDRGRDCIGVGGVRLG